MVYFISKLRCLSCVFALTLLVANPLWADDTEIFFSRASTADTQPNVLFILDGSGSMAWYDCANGSVRSQSCNDGTPNGTTTRLSRLKSSLKTVLNNTSNVNVGLMRLSHTDSGGRIIYPVRDIDQQICNGQPCKDDSVFTAQSSAAASGDDATELPNGDVSVSESTIALTTRTATSTKPVSYEYFEGTWTSLPDFNSLTPVDAGSLDNFSIAPASQSDYFGFRQHATLLISTPGEYTFSTSSDDGSQLFINNQLVVDNNGLHGMRYREGKITLQPGEHTIVVTYFERTGGTGLSVAWAGPGFTARPIDSFVTPPTGDNAWVGLRFPDLQIPQGATITDARLDVSSASDSSAITNLVLHAEDTENSAPFTVDSKNISGRDRSYNSVNWNAIPEWDEQGNYESPDLSGIVQLIVNKTGWCGGNALGLIIKGNGQRLIDAFDGGTGASPKLRVSYKLDNIPDTGGCTTSTFVTRISDPKDDATELLYNNQSYGTGLNYSVAPVARSTYQSYGYVSGFRFSEINVPKDAEIVDATLSLTTKNYGWFSSYPPLKITAHNDANPASLQARSYNITNGPRTTSITWDNIPATSDIEVTSPSIKNIVQDIVDKGDWDIGNPMVFILEDDGSGGHNFLSYDSSPSKSAQLKITFKSSIRSAQDEISGPVSDVRSEIISEIDSMVAKGGTPTVGAMLEARRYFAGENVNYGLNRFADSASTGFPQYRGRYSRVSTPDSYTGGTIVRDPRCNINAPDGVYCASEHITGTPIYVSPFTHECQSNHIVLLTDGIPTEDATAEDEVKALTGAGCVDQSGGKGTCGEELASYLHTNDQHTFSGDQTITTHTIGFNFTTQWLKDIANDGGGGFYTADTASQLSAALANIIDSVQDDGSSFVAPGATVDNFSKVSHRSDIYLALFQPRSTPDWNGNLKRYDFSGNPATLHDKNENPALDDDDSGNFKDSSQSFWSTTADGNIVAQGGAAGRLTPSTRNVFTYTGSNENLTDDTNEFSTDNDLITTADLGLDPADTTLRENIINWALGYDIKDVDKDNNINEPRYHIGDPLHSQPVIITYGGTSDEPDSVIYFGTNDGFLHGISTDDGDEVFSFIPKELIPNLNTLYESNPAEDKVYGLDGSMSLWTEDKNYNGTIDDGDHVYLYAGMRRGGQTYYSLDITKKDSPKFKWQISNTTTGFSELGETWSQAVVTSINYLGTETKVLIFGGGYDRSQDDHVARTADTVGRAIYIVNAETGALLWSGGPKDGSETKSFDDMIYSFPSTPKAVDTNGNGNADQIYVGDMGGRIWRFDIDEHATNINHLIHGGIVADLGTDGSISDTRRFYHSPDISIANRLGKKYVNIAIGSGYQAHPLDTVIEDRFYLIRYPYNPIIDENGKYHYGTPNTTVSATDTITPSGDYSPILESNLFNATNNVLGEGSDTEVAQAEQELAASDGWFIEMERSGEKVLGSSVTFDNKILFASYVPGDSPVNCAPEIGFGVFWALNLWDATPVTNLSDSDAVNLKKSDRNKQIPGGGIPAPVQTLFIESGNKNEDGEEESKELQILAISGANSLLQLNNKSLVKRVYWSEYPNF